MMLANQFKILQLVGQKEFGDLDEWITALENGYESQYDSIFQHIYDELPAHRCYFVIDVLNLYRAMIFSWKRLGEPVSIDRDDLVFDGFDGNTETDLMSFATYYVGDLGRFKESAGPDPEEPYFNSHQERSVMYGRMLDAWSRVENQYELTEPDIQAILASRYPGS